VKPALRYELAGALGDLFSDRTQIINLVESQDEGFKAGDLPEGSPRTLWLHVLVSLERRNRVDVIKSILHEAGKLTEEVDWTALIQESAAPTPPTAGLESTEKPWSETEIELRWAGAGDASEAVRVAHGSLTLYAILTIQYGGGAPDVPSLTATSSWFFGKAQSLDVLEGGRKQDQDEILTITKRIKPPLRRFFTQRITVTSGARSEHRYVLPSKGALVSVFAWVAFAVLATYRIGPLLGSLSALVAGLISPLLWARLSPGLGRIAKPTLVRGASLLAALETTLGVLTVLTILLFVLPPRFSVLVTNRTQHDIEMSDGTSISRDDKLKTVWTRPGETLDVAAPYCVCGRSADCKCDASMKSLHGIPVLTIGCIDHECDKVKRTAVTGDGDRRHTFATLLVPKNAEPSELFFEPGSLSTNIVVNEDRDSAIRVAVIEPDQKARVALGVLMPNEPEYKLDFKNQGQLVCKDGSRRVAAISIERAGATLLEAHVGGVDSSWTWPTSVTATDARICLSDQNDKYSFGFELEHQKEQLDCSGGTVTAISAFEVAPVPEDATHQNRAKAVVIKSGSLTSRSLAMMKSSTATKAIIHACTEAGSDTITLEGIAQRQTWMLPASISDSGGRVHVTAIYKPEQPQQRRVAELVCPAGGIVTGVRLDSVPKGSTFARQITLDAETTIFRLDDDLGVTCGTAGQNMIENQICSLSDAVLRCVTRLKTTECQIRLSGEVEPHQPSKNCPQATSPGAIRRAKASGASHGLDCTEVFACPD
jgi:hypothetical protein